MSPFRQAVVKTYPGLPELAKAASFPISRILLDHFPQDPWVDTPTELPDSLADQFLTLPNQVREHARVVFKAEFIILSLPLPRESGRIIVSYINAPPYSVKAVYASMVCSANSPVELTKEVFERGTRANLCSIYSRAVEYAYENSAQANQRNNLGQNRRRLCRLQAKRAKRNRESQWKWRLSHQTREEM
jgi:hypothetical protein